MFWLEALVVLSIIAGLLFIRVPLWIWTFVLAVWLAGQQYFFQVSLFMAIIHWSVFATLALILNLKFIRRRLITSHFLSFFRKKLPTISATEQAALDAGDIWWESKLLQGMPNWNKLNSMQASTLTSDEQNYLDNEVNHFCSLLDSWKIEQNRTLPASAMDYIKQAKLFGMIVPKEYGGLDFSSYAQSCIVTKIATCNMSAAITVMVPNSLGPAELLLHYGTEEQKQYYLPRLANADEIPCFALTGPEAGSDAGAMPDRGVVCKQLFEGKETLGISLNFDKRYITLAPIATLLGIAFKLYDPDNLLNRGMNLGITLALIPANHPGVEIGDRHLPVNSAFMNGPVRGSNVFIPLDWIIGGVDKIGMGWRMLMECLAAGRGISLPALSSAFAVHAYQTTSAYSVVRQQFKTPIGQFEGIKDKLGAMGGLTYMMEAVRQFTTRGIDDGLNPAVATAITKYHMTEMARICVIDALDIHGGKAIMYGPNNYLLDHYLGIPVAITVEGANILTRNLIIFGQGAIRCHPYLLAEVNALSNDDKKAGSKAFDKALFAHIGFTLSNFVRTIILGLTNGKLALKISTKHKELIKYQQKLSRFSSALAFVSDITLLVLGGQLKRKESLSARLGDALSYLYLASAVMYYYNNHTNSKDSKNNDDYLYASWCLNDCLEKMQAALYEFIANFPNCFIRALLKWTVFPTGRKLYTAKDDLTHKIADTMFKTSSMRTRLTDIHYKYQNQDYPVANLEYTFEIFSEVKPILKKLKQAQNELKLSEMSFKESVASAVEQQMITSMEAEKLINYDTQRLKVINVDEFKADDSILAIKITD